MILKINYLKLGNLEIIQDITQKIKSKYKKE
jgi:hypothetical protein